MSETIKIGAGNFRSRAFSDIEREENIPEIIEPTLEYDSEDENDHERIRKRVGESSGNSLMVCEGEVYSSDAEDDDKKFSKASPYQYCDINILALDAHEIRYEPIPPRTNDTPVRDLQTKNLTVNSWQTERIDQ
uniref:Uncharacterized protein n=1 Tax=Panagrolaimus sp. JU765 TaxID=591449 RepID=A0AC34RMN3_9BILA